MLMSKAEYAKYKGVSRQTVVSVQPEPSGQNLTN